MKKIFAMLLVLVLVVSLIPVYALAASCPDGNHDWSKKDGKCAVLECQAKCSHNMETWAMPNCVKGGYESGKCTICGMGNGTWKYHEPKAHTFVAGVCSDCGAEEVNPDTCTHTWNDTTCTTCGTTHTHNSDKTNIQPCGSNKDGYNTKYCSVCNKQMEMVKIPMSHTFVDGVCTVCSTEEPEEECDVHTWNQTDTCSVCGATHTHDSNKTNIQDCTNKEAYNTKSCSECGLRMEMVKTPGSHDFEDGVCTVCGEKQADEECDDDKHVWNQTEDCSVCGATHTHDSNKTNIQPCGTDGAYNAKSCSKCGKQMERVNTPASHTFEDGKCTVCGFEQPEEECEEHSWDNGVCTVCGEECAHTEKTNYQNCVTGEYNTTVCEECGEIIKIAPVPGEHTMEDGVCTVCGFQACTDGEHEWNIEGVCTKCGAACPHENTKTIHADCEGAGYVTTTCLDCGKVVELSPVPGEHDFVEGVCVNCGAEDPNYVPVVVDPDLDSVPKTGDNVVVIMSVMAGIAVVAAAAYVFGKKRVSC